MSMKRLKYNNMYVCVYVHQHLHVCLQCWCVELRRMPTCFMFLAKPSETKVNWFIFSIRSIWSLNCKGITNFIHMNWSLCTCWCTLHNRLFSSVCLPVITVWHKNSVLWHCNWCILNLSTCDEYKYSLPSVLFEQKRREIVFLGPYF